MQMRIIALILAGVVSGWAQLTMDQKISDFQEMVGLFAKGYGPHDWKKQAFGIDLYDTPRWLDKVRATKDDLEFYDVMSEWVSQLNDAHDGYSLPSNFVANLNFLVDIYEGKLLVDYVDRNRLPASQYPIAFGYELVSIDGVAAERILDQMLRYNIAANDRSTRRFAAELITYRPQGIIPSAASVPEISTAVFRRFDGMLETYRIPWTKTGLPLTSIGRFPGYSAPSRAGAAMRPLSEDSTPVDLEAAVRESTDRLINFRLPRDRAVVSFGSLAPVFSRSLPASFQTRLGRSSSDPFYSGFFTAGGYTIGYLRIPTFAPSDSNTALTLFAREVAFFQDNVDGLVVDVMRNGGGSSSYASALMGYLIHYPWRNLGVEIRATSAWIRDMSSSYESLKAAGAPDSMLAGYRGALQALQEANRSGRVLTTPVPWDFSADLMTPPVRDRNGNLLSFTKPVMLLADEMSASAADGFAAIIQDNGRGPIFGMRTMGAGGNVTGWYAGTYSGGQVSMTQSLMSRQWERAEAGGYPVNHYVENVGVHPEFEVDYMTRDNLFQNGKPFVDAFVAAMVDHIRKNR